MPTKFHLKCQTSVAFKIFLGKSYSRLSSLPFAKKNTRNHLQVTSLQC